MDRDVEHLVLEDDHAERLAQRLLQQRMVGGRLVRRVLAQPLPALDIWMHGLALDRPRTHERDLHRQVVEVLRLRAQDRLHLRAALDLEAAHRVGVLDLGVHVLVFERDAREVDLLAARARDQVDALLDGGEHPEPEQVDLQKAGVRARVLVPLAHLPAGHRRRLHGDDLDERSCRDHHSARMLRDVPRQAGDLRAQLGECPPARRLHLLRRVGKHQHFLADARGVPAVGELREPFEVGERQAECLADVADRATRSIRREARDERRMLAAVFLGDADDQLLADVAREVEVDVRHRRQLAIEEAAEREVVRDRVDVRQPGEIADERADGRAAPASGRQYVAHRAGPAHVVGDLARKLQDFPVEQEEACETELVDQRELLFEPLAHAALVAVEVRVALGERVLADAAQLHDRGLRPVGEVGIAVAELLGEVERQPLGELDGARCGVAVVGKAVEHVLRRGEDGLVVAAPLALAAVERGAAADRDEHVLQRGPTRIVCVHVAGGDGAHLQRLGKVAQCCVAADVAALVRALHLDEETLGAEGAGDACDSVGLAHGEPVARAAGEADETLVQLLEPSRLERRRQRVSPLLRPGTRVGVCDQPAEVRVALRRLDEQRHVRAAVQCQLCARDRLEAEVLRRVRVLERAVDSVVVGERERRVPELRRPRRELLRLGGSIEEGVRAVGVELDVGHPPVLHEQTFVSKPDGRLSFPLGRFCRSPIHGELGSVWRGASTADGPACPVLFLPLYRSKRRGSNGAVSGGGVSPVSMAATASAVTGASRIPLR